jgi:hypothetical protein
MKTRSLRRGTGSQGGRKKDEGLCLRYVHNCLSSLWWMQGVLRSLTLGTRALLGSTNGVLDPYEEAALGSCEACVAVAQWFSGLLFMQYHVHEEYCQRRQYLKACSQRTSSDTERAAMLSWPYGSPSGKFKLVIAYVAPIVAFAAAWQVWLIMLHWQVHEWHVEGHVRSSLLRLPYAFSSGGSHLWTAHRLLLQL